jgi:hypothetical protein
VPHGLNAGTQTQLNACFYVSACPLVKSSYFSNLLRHLIIMQKMCYENAWTHNVFMYSCYLHAHFFKNASEIENSNWKLRCSILYTLEFTDYHKCWNWKQQTVCLWVASSQQRQHPTSHTMTNPCHRVLSVSSSCWMWAACESEAMIVFWRPWLHILCLKRLVKRNAVMSGLSLIWKEKKRRTETDVRKEQTKVKK